VARINGWKGYIPSVAQEGALLEVFDDAEHDKKIRMGYVRVGPYKGDPGEEYPARRRSGVESHVKSTGRRTRCCNGCYAANLGDVWGSAGGCGRKFLTKRRRKIRAI
jgi:hypothetical protein